MERKTVWAAALCLAVVAILALAAGACGGSGTTAELPGSSEDSAIPLGPSSSC